MAQHVLVLCGLTPQEQSTPEELSEHGWNRTKPTMPQLHVLA